MKKILFIIASLFVYSGMMGQGTEGTLDPTQCDDPANLVRNPGFECFDIRTSFPSWYLRGHERLEYGIDSELGWWGVGSPDHYHRESDSFESDVPIHEPTRMEFDVNIETHGGTPNDGYYGFRVEPDKFEYVCTKLRYPINPGFTHNISFELRLSSLSEVYPNNQLTSHYALGQISLLFSNSKTSSSGSTDYIIASNYSESVINTVNLPISINNIQDQLQWRTINLTVTNTGTLPLYYLSIGNFEASPIYYDKDGNSVAIQGSRAYYYIDDFDVEDVQCNKNCTDFMNDLNITQDGCCLEIQLNGSLDYGCIERYEIWNGSASDNLLYLGKYDELIAGKIFCPDEYSLLLPDVGKTHEDLYFRAYDKNNELYCYLQFQYNNCAGDVKPIIQNPHGDCCYDLSFQKKTTFDCDDDLTVVVEEIGSDNPKAPVSIDGTIEICDDDGDGILKYSLTYLNSNGECVGYDLIEYECDNCCNNIDVEIKQSTHSENDCCYRFEITTDANYNCNEIKKVSVENTIRPEVPLIYEDLDDKTQYQQVCLYTPDETNLKFTFIDAQNDIICEKFVTVPGCTCECPDDLDDWLIVDKWDDMEDCDGNCYIVHQPVLPTPSNCFTNFEILQELEYRNSNNDLVIDSSYFSGVIDMLGTDLSSLDKCLEKYLQYNITLKLFKADGDSCVIKKNIMCFDNNENRANCDLGCIETWEEQDPIDFPIPNTGCRMYIQYETRDKCDNWQDVHIFDIIITNANNPGQPCIFTDKSAYEIALGEVAERNVMNFEPTKAPECNDMWRVSKASCWTNWTTIYDGLTGGVNKTPGHQLEIPSPYLYYYYSYDECDADCCAKRVRVCRNFDGTVTITDLGIVSSVADSCANVDFEITYDDPEQENDLIPCYYSCDFFEQTTFSSKVSVAKIENENSGLFDRDEKDMLIKYNVDISNTLFNLLIDKTKGNNIEIIISDISGTVVETNQFGLNQNEQNDILIDLSNYKSGAYVYSITLDGIKIQTDKFIITK